LALSSGSHRTAAGPERYTGPAFSFTAPRGWHLIEYERQLGPFRRTRLSSPDGSETLIIDRSPGEPLTPAAKQQAVERATAATTRGYRRISVSATTVAGRRAVTWEFVLPQGARVDLFERA